MVRKLNSNKTQILHRIRLRKYESHTVLKDVWPEGNLHPDDEIIIPQDDLYVITWETNFGEFLDSAEKVTIPTRPSAADTFSGSAVDASPPDEIFTDVDLRSTGPSENEKFEKTRSVRTNDELDDQQLSGGSDTIVPEVLEDEYSDVIVENESPRGGK